MARVRSTFIDLNIEHDLDDYDDSSEEVEAQYFKISISDANAKTAALMAARVRACTAADKHRETRVRRAELRSLAKGEVTIGYFKTGVNKGAELLRQGMHARPPRRCWYRRRVV